MRRNPAELSVADYLCRVTISRFNRDRGVFDYLAAQVLPELGERAIQQGRGRLTAWSVGCASGEEPYTLALVWHFLVARRVGDLGLTILGTDIDETLLRRAERACYSRGSLRELPSEWLARAFEAPGREYCLTRRITDYVRFERHDVRDGPVDRGFDLVLCRNLAFTYFDEELQCATAEVVYRSLRDDGALVLGRHETLPDSATGFTEWSAANVVYRRKPEGASPPGDPIRNPHPG